MPPSVDVSADLIAGSGLTQLREMFQKIDGKILCDMNDRFLLRFLRHRNFNVDAAYAAIKQYYKLRREFPQKIWPQGKGIKWMEPYVSLNNCTVLPEKNPRDNTRIFAWRKGLWKPEEGKFDLADYLTWSLYMTEYVLFMREDGTEDEGWTSIMDMAGFETRHVPYCDVRVIKAYVHILKGALPFKVKAVHFVNVPVVFQFVLKLIKRLLDDKLRDRIFIHSSVKNLHHTIDPEVLPEEYGGSGTALSSKWIFEEMVNHEEAFVSRSYHGYRKHSV